MKIKTIPCDDCDKPVRWDEERRDYFHVNDEDRCFLNPRSKEVN